jgi:predicted short-subunit dehydrogenase-like oxidoreductase (DUF2520 family)
MARDLSVTIIGAGRVGSVLGRVLVEEGTSVLGVLSRTRASARRAARFIGARLASDRLTDFPPKTTLAFIATPHDAIPEVARGLAQITGFDFRRLAVCHASGMHTASVLEPLRAVGAAVFSFHPLQTFPRDFPPRDILPAARGIVYGVDGDRRGMAVARRLARALRGRILPIPPDRRELYHATCVVASNHLTTMLAVVEAMALCCGIPEREALRAFGPILGASLANARRTSPAAALSGPIARGGIATVARHLEAVRKEIPGLLPYFVAVSAETVRLALRKGSLTGSQASALQELLTTFEPFPPQEERTP